MQVIVQQRPSNIRIPTHLIRVAIISDPPGSERALVATINAVRNASHSHARGTIACRGCRGTHNTNTGSTLVCYLSCVVCCTVVLSPMRCEYGLKSHVCIGPSRRFFTTRTAARNEDIAARTTAREMIAADAMCAVLARVVVNPFLSLLTTNLTNQPTPPALQQYSLTTHISSSAAVLQCPLLLSPGGRRSDVCSCFELCVRTTGIPTHM